jgi:hypothetical protein
MALRLKIDITEIDIMFMSKTVKINKQKTIKILVNLKMARKLVWVQTNFQKHRNTFHCVTFYPSITCY